MQQTHNFKRKLFTLKIVGNTQFFPQCLPVPTSKNVWKASRCFVQTPFPGNFPSEPFICNVCHARAHSSFLSLLPWQRSLLAASRRWMLLLLAPSPRALLLLHASTVDKANRLSGSVEQGRGSQRKKRCWAEIKLYAVISKNLRFMENIHLEGEIHQGAVGVCQKPTVPTLLQNQHWQSKHQKCTRMQESSCFS